jgi:hypothetical protein
MKIGACAAMDTAVVFSNIFEDDTDKYIKLASLQVSILGTHY